MPCGYTRGRVVLRGGLWGNFRHHKLRRYPSCLVLASECWPQRFSGSAAVRECARVVGSEWRGHLAWVASEIVAYFYSS